MVVDMNPAIIIRTVLLFEIFEYAIYITVGIAFASVVMDRTIGILPYVLLLCTYPLAVIIKILYCWKRYLTNTICNSGYCIKNYSSNTVNSSKYKKDMR